MLIIASAVARPRNNMVSQNSVFGISELGTGVYSHRIELVLVSFDSPQDFRKGCKKFLKSVNTRGYRNPKTGDFMFPPPFVYLPGSVFPDQN